MFGMGFTEMLIIAVIAILFLGPDKLPGTMVEIAKFFRSVKNTVGTMKDSLEEEMSLSEIKKEALAYKQELLDASENLNKITDTSAQINDLPKDDSSTESEKKPTETQKVTFKKKEKKQTKEEDIKDV